MTVDHNTLFIEALKNKDSESIARIPKSDLHNHVPYGGNRTFLEIIEGRTIPKCDQKFHTIPEMNAWCKNSIKVKNDYQLRVIASYVQAKQDGIKVFAPNFAFCAQKEFDTFNSYIEFIRRLGEFFGEHMQIYPEFCLDRNKYNGETEEITRKFLSTGLFRSIDLVGDEFLGVDNFVECYKIAKEYGIIRKAHVGEFADYKYVIDAIEKLGLESVQHGISLVKNKDAMDKVKAKGITLIICPSSNLMLSRVSSMEDHPITKLHRYGIKVSIGSDDVLIFGSSITNEYIRLAETSLTADETNTIRLNGLNFYN